MSDIDDDDYFVGQQRRMDLPDEDLDEYISRAVTGRTSRLNTGTVNAHDSVVAGECRVYSANGLSRKVDGGYIVSDSRATAPRENPQKPAAAVPSSVKRKPNSSDPFDVAVTKKQKRSNDSNSEKTPAAFVMPSSTDDCIHSRHGTTSSAAAKNAALIVASDPKLRGSANFHDPYILGDADTSLSVQEPSTTPAILVQDSISSFGISISKTPIESNHHLPPPQHVSRASRDVRSSSPIEDISVSTSPLPGQQASHECQPKRLPLPSVSADLPGFFVPQATSTQLSSAIPPIAAQTTGAAHQDVEATSKVSNHSNISRRRNQVIKTTGAVGLARKAVDTSNVTTPGNSSAGTPRKSVLIGGRSKVKATTSEKKGKGKAKGVEKSVTPLEYAQKVQEMVFPKAKSLHMKGKCIFYIGGDNSMAGPTTRGRMGFIVRHGGTLLASYDPTTVTHIVTEATAGTTLRALGLKSLKDIPQHVPTVKWSWASCGSTPKAETDFMHAAFPSRIDAGSGNGIGRKKEKREVDETGAETSRISEFTEEIPPSRPLQGTGIQGTSKSRKDASPPPTSSHHATSKLGGLDNSQGDAAATKFNDQQQDPLAEFYAQARAERDIAWPPGDEEEQEEPEASDTSDTDDSDADAEAAKPSVKKQTVPKRGFTCDNKEVQRKGSANRDIVDKLEELMELHKSKPSEDDRWRAFSYGKCLRALRNYPTRIKSYSEARSIRHVGDKTALKIMEIVKTGGLRRIDYEKTDDVQATRLLQGIYGVGRQTAFKWYAAGIRTLEDVWARKGGIKVSPAQHIGLKFYDDLNTRMPRGEAAAIFDAIKPVALRLDPRLFIEIMGSFRRGKADCGDIDILITRPIDDGKTHAGILPALLTALRARNILTEDLSVPEDPMSLEAVYHGLCRLPEGRRRRIDFLTVPWESRGAALLYYTGDDIFNRAIRMKAGVMGYSLNQRGLFGGVVRDPRNRQVKVCDGTRVAGESERELFSILGVPWQEPHERVRG